MICGLLLMVLGAQASVVINGTRVIYNADDKEETLRISNNSTTPSLIQIWMDSGDATSTPESGKSPFFVTPPIFRVDPTKGQTVRISYAGDPLPLNKESVFWLNILDVPPMPVTKAGDDRNYMQLAIRSRIKLFFRPTGLSGSASAAAEKLQWQLVQKPSGVVMHVTNNNVFHVSLDSGKLTVAGKTYEVSTAMVAPESTLDFVVRELATLPAGTAQLDYVTINDYGAAVKHSVTPTN